MVSWITVPPAQKLHILLQILSLYMELNSDRVQFRSTVHAFKHDSEIRSDRSLFKVAPLYFFCREIN